MTTITIEDKYKRYMDSVKRANKKYIESNREEVNAKCRSYYHTHLASNDGMYRNKNFN